MPAHYPTVLERLSQYASSEPTDKKVWSFVTDKLEVSDSYTYSELECATSHLAAYLLKDCKIEPGERVLLVFFPGLAFTASLLACFKAGIVGVPVFPPDPRKLHKDLHHFVSIQKSSGANVVLTHTLYDYAKKVAGIKSIFTGSSTWPDLKWLSVDEILAKNRAKPLAADRQLLLDEARARQDLHATAFLQYTSGSTSEPKGVMITHSNLAHNLSIIVAELKADEATNNVSWLPQYHDMGLIGSYLGALYCGGRGFYLSPLSFLKDPVLWLQALSKFRGTHTQAPSFAYALAARKVREAEREGRELGLQLRAVQHMINAAEPVDYPAIVEFYDLLAPYGLQRGAVVPTYGLAEHTVFVCSGGRTVLGVDKRQLENDRTVAVLSSRALDAPGSPPLVGDKATEQLLVGCGFFANAERVELIIVDSDDSGAVLGEGRVGEIWVNSPSRAAGYYGNKEKSDEDFGGAVAGLGRGFLRTGDLGFLLQGELFVCGRLKDLIIVRGANHYPQDIERTAEQACSQALRAGCSAAFAAKHEASGTEAVVFVAELKEGGKLSDSALQALADSCRLAVSKEHGLALSCVCLLRPRTVPKTTSGKIARSWCRRALLEGTLSIVKRVDYGVDDVIAEADSEATGGIGATSVENGSAALPSLSAEALRALPPGEVAALLQRALALVAASSPAPLSQAVDPYASLTSLGLDSLTLVQFKGILERRFHVDVPDEFLFTEMASVASLADIVLAGGLSEGQKEALESGVVEGADGQRSAVVAERQPLCPWFVLCC